MIKLRKHKEIQTLYPGIIYIIRATPADAFSGESDKNFYIVEVVDRNKKDGRTYSTTLTTMDAAELKEAIGVKKKEKLVINA